MQIVSAQCCVAHAQCYYLCLLEALQGIEASGRLSRWDPPILIIRLPCMPAALALHLCAALAPLAIAVRMCARIWRRQAVSKMKPPWPAVG